MGLFDGLFGGALSSGLGMLGQYMNVGYQKELQEHAAATNYKYAEKSALNSPSWQRQGLMNAGYNPMLAVQNATSGANASWTSTGQANPVDVGSDFAKGFSNAQDIKRLENETRTTDSNIKLNEANARNAIQDAITKEIHNKYLDSREQKELGNISAQTDKLIRETNYYDALEENMKQQIRLGEMGVEIDRINSGSNALSARASMRSAAAAEKNAQTNAQWTPVKIGSGIGTAIGSGLIGFGMSKLKPLSKIKFNKYHKPSPRYIP